MQLVNRLLLALNVHMYIIQINTMTGATKTRIVDFDESSPNYIVAVLADGTRVQPTDYFGKICTEFTAKKMIKKADTYNALRMEMAIREAYPELVDELL